MSIKLSMPEIKELKPRITVFGVGGGGCNAVNNMISSGLQGVDFVVANTDAQSLTMSHAERIIQMGVAVTEGLGAGSQPEVGRAAAEEAMDEIRDQLSGAHMAFVTAGMGGGTGTGAAPVIARAAREQGILTVGVVTKPFQFEGQRRMRIADAGIDELQAHVDTLIVIPNQNLFRVANEKTTFADAFSMADQVLYSGVACITDLMVKEGLINLDFADVRTVMREMGKAMMGTGEASGDKRAIQAAEAAIANPLLDDVCMKGARGLLISITGGSDLTLFEVDEAASRIRAEVDDDANIILGATFDESLDGIVRVSVVATGIDLGLARKAAQVAAAAKEQKPEVIQPAAKKADAAPRPAEPARAQEPARVQDNVAIRRTQPGAVADYGRALAEEAVRQAVEAPLADSAFIPPQPERVQRAQPRLPRVEDFPPIAQNALKAHYAEKAENERRGGLFNRIAQGLGMRDQAEAAERASVKAPEIRPALEAPMAPVHRETRDERAPMPATRPAEAARPEEARRPQPRLGARPGEEEHLEIPAFLRRQAN
jgi:cell division protein FtsZ